MKYQAVSSFLSFSPFFFWLIRACTDDINSEQGRKLKIAAAAATFPLHLALLLWDLKNAKLQVQLGLQMDNLVFWSERHSATR